MQLLNLQHDITSISIEIPGTPNFVFETLLVGSAGP